MPQEIYFLCKNENKDLLSIIFGARKLSAILSAIEKRQQKNEDTEYMIRILGMLLQTFEWSKLRKLDFISDERKIYSYMD